MPCFVSRFDLAVNPVLNWANVVFVELRRSYIRGPKSFAQHVLGIFAQFGEHCLWLRAKRALLWMRKKGLEIKIKMDDGADISLASEGTDPFVDL